MNPSKKQPLHEAVKHIVEEGCSVRAWAADVEENIAYRGDNEDRWFAFDTWREDPKQGLFCVLDGHGGNRSANYILDIFPSILAEQIGKNDNITEDIALAFSEADKSLAEHEDFGSGSTCTMCYVNNGFLHFANVGDSKAFIVTDTEATQVNYDHKATDPAEAARIEEAEGVIVQGRIGGVIALTRSFGDGGFKWDGMIATPYVHQPIPITADLRYAVIASDGVWDMVTQEELLPLINESPQEIAKVLINLAIDRDSTDNITIIVLKF